MNFNVNKQKIYKNLFIFILYFIYEIIPSSIIILFNIKIDTYTKKSIYLIITNLIYLLFVVYMYKDELKLELKEFKLKNIYKYIHIYLLGVLLMYASNYIVSNITNIAISQNETNVREYIKLFPIYMSFSTVIYAPIVEEITFRKTFRNIFKNNYIFILISGIMFGLVHMISSYGSFNDFLMIIPYILMGIDLSYIYYKSNNIFVTITLHSMHNLILLIIQFMGG